MNPVIAELQDSDDPYANLPEGIKLAYTRDEYLWLPDADKATLIQRETEPEA